MARYSVISLQSVVRFASPAAHDYGDLACFRHQVLQYTDVPRPGPPPPGNVLVKNEYAGVNFIDSESCATPSSTECVVDL